MVPHGSLTAADYPNETVTIRCESCGREGRYRRQTLVDRFGGDMVLPEILDRIAGCERNTWLSIDRCKAFYVELSEAFDHPSGSQRLPEDR